MKTLITGAFSAAGGCALLSLAGVLPARSLAPAACFAAALILVLLHVMTAGDRRY